MLDRWALNNKKFKKAVYAACVERPNLRRAHCLHALTHAELEDYRRFQLAVPIAVIPNGVSVPLGVGPEVFVQQYPQLQGKRLLLYMGRIHRKKGVDILCQAWLRVAPLFPDAQLVLAGPDPQNTLGSIFSLADRERLLPTVTFTGMLAGELKWSALAAASFFVLPSYSEGLSVAVLEALSMGVPVIISRQCNMPEVAATASGWIIEPDTDQLSHAISECLQKPRDEVLLMGRNAQRLARDNYSWPTIGHAMGVLYKWVLGGPRPSTVYLPGELSSFTPGQSSRS
jgi:glycosyltransferase involved in cell wall biosynthesis